jgi:hypothetical protein
LFAQGLEAADEIDGRRVVRAARLTKALSVDGRLDEQVYQRVVPVSDFTQTVPAPGNAATERTEVWVTFDEHNIYISARCWDSGGEAAWVANELRRDRARDNDNFGLMLDTYGDRHDGYTFYVTPLGAMGDSQVTGEVSPNVDFNSVWDVRTGKFEGGWTVEMAIPFKSLRYRPGDAQIWGVQFRRTVRRTNETSFFTRLPASVGTGGLTRIYNAATLLGIEAPASRNLEIKPYAIASTTTDMTVQPSRVRDGDANAGVDLKYGLAQNLTADVTFNTDFAQVEVDDQQVNLTRFNLQYPEKREFYLEGYGLFAFGSVQGSGAAAPAIFFSRQIGLSRGRVVPTRAGGRLTGRMGAWSVGALNVQTGEETASATPATNFSVMRIRRDLLRRGAVGAIATNRSRSLTVANGSNQVYGADAAFSFIDDLNISGFYATARTTGLPAKESYQAHVDFTPDTWGVTAEHTFIDNDFNPEVGFVRRDDIQRTFVSGRVSPRFIGRKRLRRIVMSGSVEDILNTRGVRESQDLSASYETEFTTTDRATVSLTRNYDLLEQPFRIAPSVTIPAGRYTYTVMRAAYSLGAQRRWTAGVALDRGRFYDGTQTVLTVSNGRLAFTPHFAIEPSASINRIDLPHGAFTSTVLRTRVNYTFTPRMFVAGLLQYNSSSETYSANLRFRWEYQPGSELFVVYTDDRDTRDPLGRWSRLLNRAFVVKLNRLFRF